MTPSNSELVLCSRTEELPAAWLPQAGALPMSEAALCESLAGLPPRWLPRTVAEQDPQHKQWIPYILVRNPTGMLAAYPRQGTEARLHGLWSLGLGGHINPADVPPHNGSFPWFETFQAGLHRELWEEFPAALQGRTLFLGLIHEQVTQVGRVHLGAVFLHETEHLETPPGEELTGLRWIFPSDLNSPRTLASFELWSQLALRLVPM